MIDWHRCAGLCRTGWRRECRGCRALCWPTMVDARQCIGGASRSSLPVLGTTAWSSPLSDVGCRSTRSRARSARAIYTRSATCKKSSRANPTFRSADAVRGARCARRRPGGVASERECGKGRSPTTLPPHCIGGPGRVATPRNDVGGGAARTSRALRQAASCPGARATGVPRLDGTADWHVFLLPTTRRVFPVEHRRFAHPWVMCCRIFCTAVSPSSRENGFPVLSEARPS